MSQNGEVSTPDTEEQLKSRILATMAQLVGDIASYREHSQPNTPLRGFVENLLTHLRSSEEALAQSRFGVFEGRLDLNGNNAVPFPSQDAVQQTAPVTSQSGNAITATTQATASSIPVPAPAFSNANSAIPAPTALTQPTTSSVPVSAPAFSNANSTITAPMASTSNVATTASNDPVRFMQRLEPHFRLCVSDVALEILREQRDHLANVNAIPGNTRRIPTRPDRDLLRDALTLPGFMLVRTTSVLDWHRSGGTPHTAQPPTPQPLRRQNAFIERGNPGIAWRADWDRNPRLNDPYPTPTQRQAFETAYNAYERVLCKTRDQPAAIQRLKEAFQRTVAERGRQIMINYVDKHRPRRRRHQGPLALATPASAPPPPPPAPVPAATSAPPPAPPAPGPSTLAPASSSAPPSIPPPAPPAPAPAAPGAPGPSPLVRTYAYADLSNIYRPVALERQGGMLDVTAPLQPPIASTSVSVQVASAPTVDLGPAVPSGSGSGSSPGPSNRRASNGKKRARDESEEDDGEERPLRRSRRLRGDAEDEGNDEVEYSGPVAGPSNRPTTFNGKGKQVRKKQ